MHCSPPWQKEISLPNKYIANYFRSRLQWTFDKSRLSRRGPAFKRSCCSTCVGSKQTNINETSLEVQYLQHVRFALLFLGGWYQNEEGQKMCKKCVNGTFVSPNNAPGRSPLQCSVCPTGTNRNVHAGYRACPCLDGYYRLDRFGPCTPCNVTSTGLVCKGDYPAVKPGYWWSWNDSRHEQEQFVDFAKQLEIEDDSYEESTVTFTGRLPMVYRCPLEGSCQGGTTNEEMCATGYVGPLCALCDINYFSWFNACQRCPPVWRGVLQFLLVVVLFISLMFGLFKADRLRMTYRRRATTVIDQIASKAKILIGFAQVMASVLSALAFVPWPDLLLRVGNWLKSLELNIVEIANPSCLSSHLQINFLERTVINIGAQFLLVSFVFVYYQLRYSLLASVWPCFRAQSRQRSLARRSCLRNSWWILFLCYPSTAAHIMSTLPYKEWTCTELCQYDKQLQKDCPWYLKTDLSIRCDYTYDSHNKVLFVVCWSMAMYVVLLPLLMLYGLSRRRRLLTLYPVSDEKVVSLKKRENEPKDDFLTSLEFLDENYKTKFWYWELLEIARKFLMTCGLGFFGSSSLSGVAIAAFIANVFLLLHAQFKPIKRKSEQLLQLMSLLVISLSLMLGTLISLEKATCAGSGPSDEATDRHIFSVIILLVHGFFVLYLLGMQSPRFS